MLAVRTAVVCCVVLIATFFAGSTANAVENQSGYHNTEIDGYTFRVRDGFELSKVAGADLVTRPTVCDWDDQGRLVVVSSAGAKGKVEEQLESKPHSVVRLIDDNGDGTFDRRITAAKDLSFYSGVLCVGNDLFVSAPPSIWKLTDADGDGVCESREVWYDGGTLTYCANDLHGPYLGPDGWIYWCKGAFGEQTHLLTNGSTLESKAAHILRKRPEGGPVEIITSGGMDNPIELAFLATGERFFTSTFLQHPSGGRRDGIAHAVHGSVYGKWHNVIDGLPRTGDLMPVMTHLGPAAPTGLVRRRFGNREHDLLVCGQFNTRSVSQHQLIPAGATYTTINQDLVTCERLDFHPTDVIEDVDGSLLFLDTGDWYDLCCPSSGAEGQRATGGVYRLREIGLPKAKVPVIDWDGLTHQSAIKLLDDPRFRVRDRASAYLVSQSSDALPAIERSLTGGNEPGQALPDRTTITLAWILARIEGEACDELFDSLLGEHRSARVKHAVLMAAMHRSTLDQATVRRVMERASDAGLQRAAAQWLGIHGDQQAIASLMNVLQACDWSDRVLRHSLLYALIELEDSESVVPFLGPEHSKRLQYAALIVLDQIADDKLDVDTVYRLFREAGLPAEYAADVLKRNREWATETAPKLISLWKTSHNDQRMRSKVVGILSDWRSLPRVNEMLLKVLGGRSGMQHRLELVANVPVEAISPAWDKKLAQWFAEANSKDQLAMADWLAQADLTTEMHPQLTHAMIDAAQQSSVDPANRLRFAAAIPAGVKAVDHQLSGLLTEAMLNEDHVHLQSLAAEVASRLTLDGNAVQQLLDHVDRATTATLPLWVEAIVASGLGPAEQLLDRLAELKVARTLQKEFVVSTFGRYEQLKLRASTVAGQLNRRPVEMAKVLADLEASLPKGDKVRGTRVFHGQKAACGKCHLMGDIGGIVGPELSRIGRSRSRTDLLEAIVFPNSHIAQGYRSLQVLTKDGDVYHGIINHETASSLKLLTGIDREITINKSEIERQQPSDVSIMPAGLEGSLSKQELADVLELLQVHTSR